MLLRLRSFAVIFVALGLNLWACAQATSLATNEVARVKLGQSAVPLNGPWKFSVGDSPLDPKTGQPVWAQPEFDDAAWENVDLNSGTGVEDPISGMSGYAPGWTMRGHPGYWGYAWYRIRVQLDTLPGERLAVTGPADVDDVYQAFANGTLLGSFGGFSSNRPVSYYSQPKMFDLPDLTGPPTKPESQAETGTTAGAANRNLPRNGRITVVLAFRIWMEPNSLVNQPDAGGFHTPPVLGETGAVTAGYQLRWLELVRAYGLRFVEGILYFVLSLVVLSLTLFDRSDRVYRWISAVLMGLAIINLLVGFGAWTQIVSYVVPQVLRDVFLNPVVFAGWGMVWWVWFRLRRPAWVPSAIAIMLLSLMVAEAMAGDLFYTIVPHSFAATAHFAAIMLRLAFLLLIVMIVMLGTRRQAKEGFLVLPAVVLLGISRFSSELAVLHIRLTWFPFGVQIGLGTIANLLMVGGVAVLLLRRLVNSLREQRLLALDVKQAQEVQQVMLPELHTVYPGLVIESEYRPAREVGGDFFQIIQHPTDGSMLIVAGDVTGKGLKAGMLVALLVGAIRSTVELNDDPEFLLCALNRRLIGRGDAHATALAIRIEEDGSVLLANAGHLPPYLNGQPVAVEGSLPLGLVEEAECSILRFQLAEQDRLVLLSDGIAEATDLNGQLFGFERVHDLLQSRMTAAELANAAQTFGQEDDISVILVTRKTMLQASLV